MNGRVESASLFLTYTCLDRDKQGTSQRGLCKREGQSSFLIHGSHNALASTHRPKDIKPNGRTWLSPHPRTHRHRNISIFPKIHTHMVRGPEPGVGIEHHFFFVVVVQKSISLTTLPANDQEGQGFFVQVTPILILCWLTHPSARLPNSLLLSAPAC